MSNQKSTESCRGTDQSFLTRLVPDKHNEYGFDDVVSDIKKAVMGLKSKFKSKVRVVGLSSGSTSRGQVPAFNAACPEKVLFTEP
jgi:cephalosporin-C deacetylase-like acetyl esterase